MSPEKKKEKEKRNAARGGGEDAERDREIEVCPGCHDNTHTDTRTGKKSRMSRPATRRLARL